MTFFAKRTMPASPLAAALILSTTSDSSSPFLLPVHGYAVSSRGPHRTTTQQQYQQQPGGGKRDVIGATSGRKKGDKAVPKTALLQKKEGCIGEMEPMTPIPAGEQTIAVPDDKAQGGNPKDDPLLGASKPKDEKKPASPVGAGGTNKKPVGTNKDKTVPEKLVPVADLQARQSSLFPDYKGYYDRRDALPLTYNGTGPTKFYGGGPPKNGGCMITGPTVHHLRVEQLDYYNEKCPHPRTWKHLYCKPFQMKHSPSMHVSASQKSTRE
ncbi:unnamed protein product [Amoebophrya sp. A120]|nr:unnamed protein product [Amoebophrya sp. A120]|eukprot:GSA120T00019914001.1